MPRATDKTFIDKLNQLWKGKSQKYEIPRFNEGFILHHYAGKVEYSTVDWLDKNKDPLNENVTRLLAASTDKYVASIFSDYQGDQDSVASTGRAGVMKKGAFRTVAQRHKEQLTSLMTQLYSTEPHFVRCIIPNEDKKPGKINLNQVLDQLRCNGVLEGIRICRAGFPNRLPFSDFRQRYEVLTASVIPKGFIDGRRAVQLMLEALALDKNQYRLGNTKVFFRAGVLAELEELRDVRISKIVTRIQAAMRGFLARRKYKKKLDQFRAIRIIQRNARVYVALREWPWWKLYTKVKPLLNVTRTDEELRKKEELAKEWEDKANKEKEERAKLEAIRSQLEAEKKSIEDLLIREQNAAANQTEILQRVQQREVDLNERLKELNLLLEEKDSQNEELLKNKKKIELELAQLRDNYNSEKGNVERLEKDKASKELKIRDIEEKLSLELASGQKLDLERKSMESHISQLKSQVESLGANESDLSRNKLKLTTQVTDLETKLASETDEKTKLDHKRTSLESEIRTITDQLAGVNQVKSDMDAVLKRKEVEIVDLNKKLDREISEKTGIDRQRLELETKLSSTLSDLSAEKDDLAKLSKLKKKLEDELAQYGKLVEQKGNEESKQTELRKIRENELSELKNQITALQFEHDETRKKNNTIIENLKADINVLTLENQNILRLKQGVEKQLVECKADLESTEESRAKIEKSRKNIEVELLSSQDKCADLETSLSESKSMKETLEKQISNLNLKVSDAESINTRIERERAALMNQINSLTDDIEQESTKRVNVENQKKKLQLEVSDLQARLDEDDLTKIELNKKIVSKTVEVDQLREKMSKEIQGRIVELEEMKRKVDIENSSLLERNTEMERNNLNLEKTKARLSSEVEDSRVEIEREHGISRQAEKQMKQVEIQLATAVLSLDGERKQKDIAESNARKLQSSIDGLTLEVQQREMQIVSIQKGKNELDMELKTLMSENGDRGKNYHDLEKLKRRAEEKVTELQVQFDNEEVLRMQATEQKTFAENSLAEMQLRLETKLSEKDKAMDDTRRLLLKEVNSLGEQGEDLQSQRNELQKQKKKLEDQVNELANRAEYSEKGQSDLEKTKKKSDQNVRELQGKLDEEEKLKKNFEELALRHEKKANSLQSDIERFELQVEGLERQKKNSDKRIEELQIEVEGGETKAVVNDAKKRFEREMLDLQRRLEESEELRNSLEAAKSNNSTELESLRSRAREDFEGKIESLEESRRALLAAQRLASQELDERTKEINNLEKQRRNMLGEIEDLKTQLETQTLGKADDNAARKKLNSEMKDLQAKLDSEYVKSFELNDAMNSYRQKSDQALSDLEISEQSNKRFTKSDASQKVTLTELESSLLESRTQTRGYEERSKRHEDEISVFQQKSEEQTQEISELQVVKRRLTDELERIAEIHKNDSSEREVSSDGLRKKYQKEIKHLIEELESEKKNAVLLKEGNKDLEIENETLTNKNDIETRNASQFRKEKERLEQRLEETTKSFTDTVTHQDLLQVQVNTMVVQIRDLKTNFEESESQRSTAEKSKKGLEQRNLEMTEQLNDAIRTRLDLNKSVLASDSKSSTLRDQLDEYQEAVRNATERQRRAETCLAEAQVELNKEKDQNLELERAKASLEKTNKDQSSKIMDFEAVPNQNNVVKRHEARIDELMKQVDAESREKNDAIKVNRKQERVVRDLELIAGDKEKQKQRFDEEIEKMDQKMKKMKTQLDELETSESNLQLAKRRAEREANEFRDRASRYEKEIERVKGRTERAPTATL